MLVNLCEIYLDLEEKQDARRKLSSAADIYSEIEAGDREYITTLRRLKIKDRDGILIPIVR